MRVSLTYDLRNPPQWRQPWPRFYREQLDHMAAMEELGYDAIWIQQHHFEESAYGPSFPAIAGVLAARTNRVRVGTHIKMLPLYNPLLVAEEMAFLDNILDGRLDVGVGIGHRLLEFQVLGINHKHRPSLMEEGVEVLRRAWTEDRVTFEGRRFRYRDIEVQPKPLQQPHPPLWVAARTVPAAQRAARLKAHLLPGTSDAEVFLAYSRTLRELGEDPAGYQVAQGFSFVITDEDPEKVWDRLRPHAVYRGRFYDQVAREMGDAPMHTGMFGAREDPESYRHHITIGSTEQVLDTLGRIRDAEWEGLRLSEILLRTPLPGLPLRDFHSTYERFARDIMPEVRKW